MSGALELLGIPNLRATKRTDLPSILGHNWGIDIGLMNQALTSKTYHDKFIDGKYRTTWEPDDLSTMRVDWDDTA